MKKVIYSFWIVIVVLSSCQDNDINLFDKSADERVAEAIANLKNDLTAPSEGWRLKYRPVSSTGSFYVLMDFNDDNTVILKTDLGVNGGEFFRDTITYRIDSSLGLELIMESYCFFSYLFEQDQASFGAEYEFLYANKTPNGELVFKSKTDVVDPTILLFEKATAADQTSLLGTAIATNLNILADDLPNFTPSYKLTFDDKDVVFYVSFDDFRRTITFKAASKKNGTQTTAVDFTTPYVIKGDSIIFDNPLQKTLLGNNIKIERIKFNAISSTSINVCASPIPSHSYDGTTSAGDDIKLESSVIDLSGRRFVTYSDFYVAPLTNIFNNGQNAGAQAAQDIHGALAMQLYYNNGGLYAMGFVIQNDNGTITYALREFTPVLTDNKIVFNFAPTISIFGNQTTDADVNNINIYLDALTQGGTTYVFEYQEGLFEFYNPCTGWSVGFLGIL